MGEFIDHLYAQGLAESTVREYDKWARRAQRWCWSHRLNLAELTAAQVREWADTLPRSRSSQKAARSMLKHYMTWVGRTDHPWTAIALPPIPKMVSRALTKDDARALRDTALLVGGDRGALATLIGLYTAARASEIAGMRWDGWTGNRLRFWRSKNRDWHTTPVHPILEEQLRAARTRAWSDYIFPGYGRPHVTGTTVWEWVRNLGRVAGVTVSTHQLRHTALTTALETTRDLQAVQQLAGHRDPAVTAGYARLSEERLEAAVGALDY